MVALCLLTSSVSIDDRFLSGRRVVSLAAESAGEVPEGTESDLPGSSLHTVLTDMMPFDSYPDEGKVPLGPMCGPNCRHGYGMKFMQITGQTTCAYCGLNLVASFEAFLQMALDHVIPRSVCKTLGLRDQWVEDCINKVLACAACNSFDNRFTLQKPCSCPSTLEAFCELRDRVFAERKDRVAAARRKEQEFYNRRPWEQRS